MTRCPQQSEKLCQMEKDSQQKSESTRSQDSTPVSPPSSPPPYASAQLFHQYPYQSHYQPHPGQPYVIYNHGWHPVGPLQQRSAPNQNSSVNGPSQSSNKEDPTSQAPPQRGSLQHVPLGAVYHQPYVAPGYGVSLTPSSPHPKQPTGSMRKSRDRDPVREEDHPEGWKGFDDKDVRAKFVRRVYTILMLQLLFTLGIIAVFVFEPHVKSFVQRNKFIYYIALAVFFAIYIGLACFESVRRKFPTNIIMLIIFTIALSYMMGTVSSFHDTDIVFMAVGTTAAVCLLVSLFSFYTKFDFTTCGGILCILLLVLILFGLIAIFLPSKTMTIIYASLGAIVFTMFLAYDTQLIMGGKENEMSPEEYVFAAIQLYVDIVQIFSHLLLLLGAVNE